MKNIRIIFAFLAAVLFITGCDDYREIHKKYLNNEEETVYIRKVDSVAVYSGRDRLRLKLWYTDANQLTHSMVYWNYGEKSMRIDLTDVQVSGKSTIEVDLPDMPEGPYDLEIYNVNKYDQRSLAVDAFGVSYGDKYQADLKNRDIRSAIGVSDSEFEIKWMIASEQLIRSEVKFTGLEGEPVIVLPNEMSTFLSPLPSDLKFTYRSFFKPNENSIDTFMVDWSDDVTIDKPEELEAVYSNFKVMDKLYSSGVVAENTNGFAVLWTRALAPKDKDRYHLTSFKTTVPWNAGFEMDKVLPITRIILWQYGWPDWTGILYQGGNAKKYNFYGSNEPNPDGSLDGSWTKFLEVEIKIPSGEGTPNADDIAIALDKGHEFLVPEENQAAYKYIRMECVERFGDPVSGAGSEWGHSTKMQVFRKFE